MQSEMGIPRERYTTVLLVKMLRAIRPHFKPVLQENPVRAAPQNCGMNAVACWGGEKRYTLCFTQLCRRKGSLYLCWWCPIPGGAQGQAGWPPAHSRGWKWMGFKVSPSTSNSMVLWVVPLALVKPILYLKLSMFTCSGFSSAVDSLW